MKEERLKVDFQMVFWAFLIAVNLLAMGMSWYVGDMLNYGFCAIMLLYCIMGAWCAIPEKDNE
jgi:hypothetical protein|tara:strand:- start:166 stop:354 length:189 start_codon:yes stop_codon:yes gene_type:complete